MLTQKQVTTSGFDMDLAGMFAEASGFTRFLCEALDIPF
jgi:hypothetical protein